MVDRMTKPPTTAWLLAVTNLPGANKTLRMRIWRSLKSSGAGTLRDGVYVLPESDKGRMLFADLSKEIQAAGGSTHVFSLDGTTDDAQDLARLFDRTDAYQELIDRLRASKKAFATLNELEARRRLSSITRELTALETIDFFPGKPRDQLRGAVSDAERALNARFSPNEPTAAHGKIVRLNLKDYQCRSWVTRERLWIDRVCSAWLIRRFIDPKAKFVWCKRIEDRPKRAIGFDFDGAQFTHVADRVTFQVLAISFGLETDAGIERMGALVHFLDVGGIPVPEAAGLSAIVLGARATQSDDDSLLNSVTPALDGLYHTFRGS
jgi:hypothetical protein